MTVSCLFGRSEQGEGWLALSSKLKLKQLNGSEQKDGNLAYYDRVFKLYEKISWVTILWAFFLNLVSPLSREVKNQTLILIAIVTLFILFYFRYFYWKVRHNSYRFYLIDIFYPVFTWGFLYLQPRFTNQLVIPYYFIILASSLSLRRFDTILTLTISSLLLFIQEVVLTPFSWTGVEIALSQIISLVLLSWIAVWLAEYNHKKDIEAQEVFNNASKENEKSEILKIYARSLALDKEKAAILLAENSRPTLIIDGEKKIVDLNKTFKDLSDFRNSSLVGKDLDYILQFEEPLDLSDDNSLTESFTAILTTRRNKTRKINGQTHFLRNQDGKVKQAILIFSS